MRQQVCLEKVFLTDRYLQQTASNVLRKKVKKKKKVENAEVDWDANRD